jgi:excisionase family DNA binding protein
MEAKTYTTREAAEAVRITRATLQAWIASGKVRAPKQTRIGGSSVRLWKESDVARLKIVKDKIYLKSRGRPRKLR